MVMLMQVFAKVNKALAFFSLMWPEWRLMV
jgi:hypothetical protein